MLLRMMSSTFFGIDGAGDGFASCDAIGAPASSLEGLPSSSMTLRRLL